MLGRLRDRLAAREDVVVGVYVYGSLVTGDYSPAASDIDVVVLVREPGKALTGELTQLHTALAGTGGPASQLHCLYVAADAASDPERAIVNNLWVRCCDRSC